MFILPPNPVISMANTILRFPRRATDLDAITVTTLLGSEDVMDSMHCAGAWLVFIAIDFLVSISTVEHAGFHDQEYRQRRDELAALASSYKHGQPIPYVQYTDTENKTWYDVAY